MADDLKNKPAEFEPPKKASPWRRSDSDSDMEIQKEDSVGQGQNEDDDETQDDLRIAS
jgi:hypothetical protein